jgi:hypothetical protein
MTKVGLYAIGTYTTLESNKSLPLLYCLGRPGVVRALYYGAWPWISRVPCSSGRTPVCPSG